MKSLKNFLSLYPSPTPAHTHVHVLSLSKNKIKIEVESILWKVHKNLIEQLDGFLHDYTPVEHQPHQEIEHGLPHASFLLPPCPEVTAILTSIAMNEFCLFLNLA